MTNIHAKQGLQTVGGFGVRRPRAGRGPDGGDSKFQIDVVVVRIVVVRIKYNPAPVLGPWFLAGAPSKLSVRPALTSMRPPRCDDFQRFERAKSSAGLGAHPPYCADRFCGGRVLASRRRAHRAWWGLRAKWPHAKCGAAALFCGVPPRLTPWAVRNSLGLPTGAFWLRTRPKKFLV